MGVDRCDYIIYGQKFAFYDFTEKQREFLDEEGYEDNGYSDVITKANDGLTVVSDGMNGDYLFIGRIVVKANEYEGFSPILLRLKPKVEREILRSISDLLIRMNLPRLLDKTKIGFWVVSHFH